jgi:hypothetical protein
MGFVQTPEVEGGSQEAFCRIAAATGLASMSAKVCCTASAHQISVLEGL